MENAPRAVQQGRRLSRCIVEVTSQSKRDRLFQLGVHVHVAVDAQFAPVPNVRAGEQRRSGGDEDFVADPGTVQVVCGPTRTASPTSSGWSARPRSKACSMTTTSVPT
jgi:hypothetical protein